MAQTVTVDIKIDVDWNRVYQKIGREFVAEFNYLFMSNLRGEISKYTPFLTGQMDLTSFVPLTDAEEGGKIVYPAFYAKWVYFMVNAKFTKVPHPEAGAMWDKKITQGEYEAMIARVADLIFDKYGGQI